MGGQLILTTVIKVLPGERVAETSSEDTIMYSQLKQPSVTQHDVSVCLSKFTG